jgi:hypothetical protein
LGATTGPLDGRALTHGVDARAGEGPAAASLPSHRATMSGSSLFSCEFFLLFWRIARAKGRERRVLYAGFWLGGAAKQAGRRRCCAELRVGGEK